MFYDSFTLGTFPRLFAFYFNRRDLMLKFLLFCLLLVVCWPIALAALILYPLVWLILLPFRLVGIVVGGTFDFIAAIFFLPGKLLRAI
jgi:hypothetical protein